MTWRVVYLLLWTLGFLYVVVRIEEFLIYKSIERFKELKQSYIKLKESKKEIEKYLDK